MNAISEPSGEWLGSASNRLDGASRTASFNPFRVALKRLLFVFSPAA
jgi:hypothetical protein